MPLDDLQEGVRVITVCNSCRYCEEYCPVFPAMERRSVFSPADMTYLANLCHNCGECLYACQYAPPHEFGINVPKVLSRLRVVSYEKYCWPGFMAAAFRRNGVATSIGLSVILAAALLGATLAAGINPFQSTTQAGNFYAVISHEAMTTLFGGVSLFVVAALIISLTRFWRDLRSVTTAGVTVGAFVQAVRDLTTLRHLHGDGVNCTSNEEERTPWRRWFHHCTFYGFMLCLASTSVASVYHNFLGWRAPYPYLSLPVVLGTLGGLGLLIGPAGLLWQRRRRDPELGDPVQSDLDLSFISLLFVTSLSGLLLLAFRESSAMGPLLIWHLGAVLALFVTMPYGKFVHGLYRAMALLNSAIEDTNDRLEAAAPSAAALPGGRFVPHVGIDSAVASSGAAASAEVDR